MHLNRAAARARAPRRRHCRHRVCGAPRGRPRPAISRTRAIGRPRPAPAAAHRAHASSRAKPARGRWRDPGIPAPAAAPPPLPWPASAPGRPHTWLPPTLGQDAPSELALPPRRLPGPAGSPRSARPAAALAVDWVPSVARPALFRSQLVRAAVHRARPAPSRPRAGGSLPAEARARGARSPERPLLLLCHRGAAAASGGGPVDWRATSPPPPPSSAGRLVSPTGLRPEDRRKPRSGTGLRCDGAPGAGVRDVAHGVPYGATAPGPQEATCLPSVIPRARVRGLRCNESSRKLGKQNTATSPKKINSK
ncbi:uncharacterized protein [Castor canadensis]|uniref:Uncharacterized protein n=1 Tax=Castor canadensis TaxID=51338 RepID=A0AC58MPR2_CASCN